MGFTKNLSADKINLSTFKGEGELSNLELDEIVLTELLELPSWLRLTNAWCNHVSFRIQWTKLKSVPIFLSLDEVHIQVETCEELRSMSSQQSLSSYGGNAKYSFINKVIDGMTVSVNTVQVTFKSPAFIASVQMQRIMVESKSPSWQRCDLRMTRLKEPDRGQLLIFKELEWQTVRIEAKSARDKDLTPLRLLTNQARCRITIKKRIADCFIMGSRLVLILDDLLWVLTDSQLKAALHFLDSLTGLVQKATEVTRIKKAARKLEVLPEYQAQISQQARTKEPKSAISRIFSRYDVVETSYHFLCQRIDLHLCDDPGDGRSVHPDLKDGGALQISLQHFQVDYYPYHLAIGHRKHWPKYREGASPHSQWLDQALAAFRNSFLDLIDQGRIQHTPLVRTQVAQQEPSKSAAASDGVHHHQHHQAQESQKKGPTAAHSSSGNPVKNYVLTQLAKLMTTCVILRIQDFTLYQVTTSKRKQMPKEFIAGDRDRYSLPEELNILHAEFTYYYYPGDVPFPLPQPKFYVQVNPIQIHFDVCSCLWLNSFALNLHQSLLSSSSEQQQAAAALMYMDVKLEAIMPRVIFESPTEHPNQRDRPKSLHFQVSRASVTNVRSMEHSSRADLAKCIDTYQLGSLFFGADFPAIPDDYHVVTDKFLKHVAGTDNVRPSPPPHFSASSVSELVRMLNRELLWTDAKDVWCVNLEPVWGDFFGASAVGSHRPVPFLDAFPLTLWVYLKIPSSLSPSKNSNISSQNGAISAMRKGNPSVPSLHNIPPTQSSSISSLSSSVRTNMSMGSDKTGICHQGFKTSEIGADVTSGRKTDFLSFNHISSRGFQDASKVSVITQSTSDTSRTSARNQDDSWRVKTADIHVLAYVSNLVSIQINHYQFLFLLRLSEEAAELAAFLALDSNRIFKQELGGSLVMGALIPQLEVTFVMPSQSPGKECSGGDLESVLPDSASIPEELGGIGNNLAASNSNVTQNVGGGGKKVVVGGVSTPVSELSSLSMDFPLHEVTSSTITTIPTSSVSCIKPGANGPNPSAFPNINIPDNLNAGISSVKKGFNSLMTTIDSALKPSPDDASDTVSLRSDASSDSENYVVVNMSAGDSDAAERSVLECVDAMFRIDQSTGHGETPLPQHLEVASEAVPEEEDVTVTTTTPSERSVDSSCKRRDLVSMSTFKLGKVEFVQQSQGFSSAIKLQLSSLTCDECGAIPWDEFQSKFSCRSRAWMDIPLDAAGHPCARIRLDHTVNPGVITNRTSFKEWCKDHIQIKVNDLSLDLNMSTVAGLADLVEDEVIPQPLPMLMMLDNIKLCLNEDRPSTNITSPGPVPINLEVSELIISRGSDGTFHIEPPVEAVQHIGDVSGSGGVLSEDTVRHLSALEHSNKQLQAENAELKRRLAALERLSKENHTLRQSTEESQILRSCLATAQDDVTSLLEEKRSLLDRVQHLQDLVEQSQRSKR